MTQRLNRALCVCNLARCKWNGSCGEWIGSWGEWVGRKGCLEYLLHQRVALLDVRLANRGAKAVVRSDSDGGGEVGQRWQW